MRSRRLAPVLAVLLALAGPALAAEPTDPLAPTATATSTADQIAQFLHDSPAADLPREGVAGVTESAPRQVHGEVGLAVGSDGYRSAYARTDLPVGKTGTLSIAVEDTRFRGRHATYDMRGVGLGLAIGGAAMDSQRDRCRQWDDGAMPPVTPDEVLDAQRCRRELTVQPRPRF